MVDHAVTAMLLARAVALGLGGVVTVIAARAYWRTRRPFARLAAMGFGVVTVGGVVEGLLIHVVGVDLVGVHTVGSLTVALGFALLLYSLRRDPTPTTITPVGASLDSDPRRQS